jgi:hypothetical protein
VTDPRVTAYLQKQNGRRMTGAVLLIGAVLSALTGYYLSHSGDTLVAAALSPTDLNLKLVTDQKDASGKPLPNMHMGGKKFDLPKAKLKPNQALLIDLQQDPGRPTSNRTRVVTIELLEPGVDEQKRHGEKPVYAATQRDPFVFDDGDAGDMDFRFHLTVPEPKDYGLLVRVSDDNPAWDKLSVTVKAVRGSAIPMYWGGAAMFLFGLIFTWIGRV